MYVLISVYGFHEHFINNDVNNNSRGRAQQIHRSRARIFFCALQRSGGARQKLIGEGSTARIRCFAPGGFWAVSLVLEVLQILDMNYLKVKFSAFTLCNF